MKNAIFYLLSLFVFNSCDDAKWETIDGSRISEEPKDIEKTIYFENENNGIVGGYTFSDRGNIPVPIAYVTADGGKKWKELRFGSLINTKIKNVHLHNDSLVCQTDLIKLISTDRGKSFTAYKNPSIIYYQTQKINTSSSRSFKFEGMLYVIRDRFENDLASVIICSDTKALNDFYFVSFDKGKNWNFIQKELGDNRAKFLLEDKYLYRYHQPFGLQRLRLK